VLLPKPEQADMIITIELTWIQDKEQMLSRVCRSHVRRAVVPDPLLDSARRYFLR